MRFQEVYKQLAAKKYFVFSFEELGVFYPDEKRTSLKQYLSRWNRAGWIASLRKGLYELTFPESHAIPDLYIANKVYSPSYVSMETALSHYSIIPEVSMAVVSITSKPTRRFKNFHGLFIYHSIQPKAFGGYFIEKYNGFNVLMAEPEKALVDYLYFKTLHKSEFDIDAQRFDKRRITNFSKKKLKSYAQIYNLNLKEILYAHL